MATPIDPEILEKLKAQGWLDSSQPVGGATAAAPPAAAHEEPRVGYDTPREDAVRSMITKPITPMRLEDAQAPQRHEGVFENPPPGGAEASGGPQWRPPPAVATAGRWAPTVSPGVRSEYDTALEHKQEAPLEVAQAQVSGAERRASLYDQQAEQVGAQMREQQIQRQARNQALDQQMADYKRLQDESAADKIDPDRWWGNKNAGEKVLGVIGIILGGLSQGQGHGNPAIDVMNKAIDNDIAAQKANIAQKGKKAEGAYNMYSQKLKQFGDADAADLATRAQMQEQFKLQLLAEAERTGSPPLIAQAHEKAADIQLEQAGIHKQMEAWQKGGSAGGITPEDQKRAFELVKSGMIDPKTNQPINIDQALQMALSIRGAAPTRGTPTLAKPGGHGGAPGKEGLANAELLESGKKPPESLGAWDRVTRGLSHLPAVGPLFQGTEGARKGLAIEAGNIPVLGFAHKGLGARTPEAQREMAGALIVQPGDSQERINQKYALRELVARKQMSAAEAEKRIGGGSSGGSQREDSGEE